MTLETFVEKIEFELDELAQGTLQADSSFREIEDWSSMHALIIIALVDTEYDVVVTGKDLTSLETVGELYEIVKIRASKNG